MRFAAISVFCLAVSTVVKLLTTPNGPSEVGGCSRQVPFVRRGHNTHPPFWPQLGDTAISRFAGVIFRLVCWGFFFFFFTSYSCWNVYLIDRIIEFFFILWIVVGNAFGTMNVLRWFTIFPGLMNQISGAIMHLYWTICLVAHLKNQYPVCRFLHVMNN